MVNWYPMPCNMLLRFNGRNIQLVWPSLITSTSVCGAGDMYDGEFNHWTTIRVRSSDMPVLILLPIAWSNWCIWHVHLKNFNIITQVSACIIHLAWICANCPFQPCMHWHHSASRSTSPVLTTAIRTALCIPWQSSLFQPKGSDALLQEQQSTTVFTKLSCGAWIEPLHLFVPLSKIGLWTCRRWIVVKTLDSSLKVCIRSARTCYPVLSASMLGALSFTYVHVHIVRSTTVRKALKSKRADIKDGQGTITDSLSEL